MASHGVPRGPRTRTDEQKRIDADKIAKYHELEAKIKQSTSFDATVFDYTTRLLRLNPEYYTVWNVRRRCLTSSLLSTASASATASASSDPLTDEQLEASRAKDSDILQGELHYTIPLLLEFPKCYWIWSYRLWVLQQAVQRLDVPRARRIWQDELALDSKMLTKDRRNFHAWGYRRQVVEQLEARALNGTSMVEAEFAYTTKMIHRDLSNFSAWHNRSKLIPTLLSERGADDAERKAFLESELGLVREALNVGPEDQSLWFYHQFLMLNLTDYIGHPTIAPGLSREERMTYIAREMDDVRELLEDYDDVKWVYEALLEYTLAVAKMDGERPLEDAEKADTQAWLDKLRELDPKRSGRWDDVEMEYIRGRRPNYE
ncbi:geranylgeranyl transferase type-2 subunit alpha [Ophiostoma piceae UAMH 11346]|uniref:Geranylgeranyl transferase type-2 subunit alpha n=1 Tax=Ophiostoma piceae (strain UAMH 11346) TaxID=1262450 RepID=S3C703_OPHP1|nr:geranylgeranyl transferase type-2 subunit alpha [Ophiostoma piceae UAMH 11346]